MFLLDYSLIFFLINIGCTFFWVLLGLGYWKIEKYKSHNSTVFFTNKPLMHKFFIKYSLFTNLLKFSFFLPVVPILMYAFWLMGLIDSYLSALDLFVGFNIGFILILLGSILFLLILYLKLVYLKKEFKSYKLKILNNIENTEMFKLVVNNCPNAFYKNAHYQKLLNKVKSVTTNKQELQGDDLWNFLAKNFNIWDAFYKYLYCCKNELNLNFKFKESSFFTPRNFNTFISFSHIVSKKDLYGKEVYEIFTSYLNSFEIIKLASY